MPQKLTSFRIYKCRKQINGQIGVWPQFWNVLSSPQATSRARSASFLLMHRCHWPCCWMNNCHDDVIKWKYFPRYWPFVRGIHRSPVNSPHKSQCRGALMFFLVCASIKKGLSKQSWGWRFQTPTCSLWRHYDVIDGGFRPFVGSSSRNYSSKDFRVERRKS